MEVDIIDYGKRDLPIGDPALLAVSLRLDGIKCISHKWAVVRRGKKSVSRAWVKCENFAVTLIKNVRLATNDIINCSPLCSECEKEFSKSQKIG